MRLIEFIQCSFGGGGGEPGRATLPAGSQASPAETPYNRKKTRKGGEDKGGVDAARKTKTSLTSQAAGGQSEGSSRVSRSYRVVDGRGRVLHKFRTKEEADQASIGNRYTRVVTQIPADTTPEVRDNIRKRPADTQVRVHRRSIPYPDKLFPGSPQGR